MRATDVRSRIRFNARSSGPRTARAWWRSSTAPSTLPARSASSRGALAEWLVMRHRFKTDALGWPHQIAGRAGRLGLDWLEVYLPVCFDVVAAAEAVVAESSVAAGRGGIWRFRDSNFTGPRGC